MLSRYFCCREVKLATSKVNVANTAFGLSLDVIFKMPENSFRAYIFGILIISNVTFNMAKETYDCANFL